jgi:ribonuclease HII
MSQNDFFESKTKVKIPDEPYLGIERRLWASGFHAIAGVDEVGRGPLAGPVVACCCLLPKNVRFSSVRDSKALTEAEREAVYQELTSNPRVKWAVQAIHHDIIDKINILRATLLAMKGAIDRIQEAIDFVLIDGRDAPPMTTAYQTVIKGDSLSQSIAAASVIAKVTRDRMMDDYHREFPQYGFDQHKGYGTKAHMKAIETYGLSPIHRHSFAPVAAQLPRNALTLF